MNARPILFKSSSAREPSAASVAGQSIRGTAAHAHHVGQDITHASFNVIVAEEARYGAG
jgi:hypothetical protein